jgi:hypothetical protein
MLLGLAGWATAQEPTTPAPASPSHQVFDRARDQRYEAQSAAWAAFRADVPGHWTSHWRVSTGTPEAIYGEGLRLPDWRGDTLTEARHHASAILTRYNDLLGLGVSEFRESIGARMGNVWSFKFDQYFRGLPVIGGRADVRVHRTGVISMFGSVAWPIPATFSTVPAISEAAAVTKAWTALGGLRPEVAQPGEVGGARLVIWGETHSDRPETFSLAWEVPISAVNAAGEGPIGRYYIDARNGSVLHYRNDKHECGEHCGATCAHEHEHADHAASALPVPVPTTVTVTGWTRTAADGFGALSDTPLARLVVSVRGIGNVTTDQNGQFTIDIAAPTTITIGVLDGTHYTAISGAEAPSVMTTVQPGVPATIQLFTSAATFNQAAHTTTHYWVDAANEWCRSILGNSPELNAADAVRPTVNIASTCNAYYTGNSINFYQAGGNCNNTAFSTVIVHEWGHGLDDRYGGISQTHGLSEGWGDILGLYMVDSPILGSGFRTAGVGIRDGNNSRTYPPPPEVHQAGEVWMGFAWRLRENLRAAFGTPQAIAITQDIVVGTIVADATDQPGAVREVFLADDNDGNLNNGVPHYAQLSAAAIAKNLPYPEIQYVTISHTPLTDTSARLTPRLVQANAVLINTGTINQVRLVYNAGSGSQTRTMIPSGAVDGYQALLPGILSGAVTYHIEVSHSSGTTIRLPATGEYSYNVFFPPTGPFVGFYAEGFETGAPGWTHAAISGTDDWQIGTPAGRSGTSQQVAWADPVGAAAGTMCYANDIGVGNFNGAYAANSSNALRTPVINCTGRSGVTLRFRRWLTVEQASADQARILVNGVQVWINPTVGHLIDTSWQTIEIPIPAADNNPSVQVEWRLTSNGSRSLGGWTIDEVELGERFTPPLDAELRILPEQAAQNAPMLVTIATQGAPRPCALLVGDTAGPTLVPGLPPILVGGGGLVIFPLATDALGAFSGAFTAPTGVPPTGLEWFAQVVTIDAGSNLVTSNQFRNLFTP